jgi:hypothetical protein
VLTRAQPSGAVHGRGGVGSRARQLRSALYPSGIRTPAGESAASPGRPARSSACRCRRRGHATSRKVAPGDADRGALRHDTLFGVEELFQHGPVSLRHRSLECCAGRPKTGPPEQVTYALAERSHIFATANHHKMPSTAERTSGANMCAAVEYSVIINASCAIYAWALTCSQEPGILFLSASHVAPPLATPTMSL